MNQLFAEWRAEALTEVKLGVGECGEAGAPRVLPRAPSRLLFVTGMCGEEAPSIVSSRLLSDRVRSRALFRMPLPFVEEQLRLHVPAEAPKSKSG